MTAIDELIELVERVAAAERVARVLEPGQPPVQGDVALNISLTTINSHHGADGRTRTWTAA